MRSFARGCGRVVPLLAEFLRRWYGADYPSRLNIVAEIDVLYYGLGLLDSKLLHGCLLTTSQVARSNGRSATGRTRTTHSAAC